MPPPEAWQVGGLMNTRGLTELVAINIGATAGLLDSRLYLVFGFLLGKAAQIVVSRFDEALKPYGIRSRDFGVLSLIRQGLRPTPQN